MATSHSKEELEHLGVCIVVLNNKDEVLLGERINGYKPGFFGLPGGRISTPETILQAAVRELKEETGLKVKDLQYIGVVREFQGTYNFIHFGFVTKNISQKPQNLEPDKCKEWQWYSLDNLPQTILHGHKAMIKVYQSPELETYRDLR